MSQTTGGDEDDREPTAIVATAAACEEGTPLRGTLRAALRYRDFRLILAAQALSTSGDWFYNVALVVFIFQRTHSASWVGAAAVVRLLPRALFSPVAGVLADRVDRRRLMIGCDVLRMFLMGVLGIAIQISWFPVVAVLALVFSSTLAGTPYWLACDALTPSIVSDADLPAVNSWVQVADNGGVLVGPVIGAAVLAVSTPSVGFFANAFTFLASALLVVAVRVPRRSGQAERGSAAGVISDLREGLRAMYSLGLAQRIGLAYYCGDWLLFGTTSVLFALVAGELLGTGVSSYGYLLAGIAAGGLTVVGVATRLGRVAQPATVLGGAMVAIGVSFGALALFHIPWVAVLLCAVGGAGNVVLDVLLISWLQRSLPSEALGRSLGVLEALQCWALIVGALVAPPLVIWLGVRGALLALGIAFGLGLPALGTLTLGVGGDDAADRHQLEKGLQR